MTVADAKGQLVVAHMLGRQEPGALLVGTRVRKAAGFAGDVNPAGTPGTILGSCAAQPNEDGVRFCYVVRWDRLPDALGFVIDKKLVVNT